MPKIGAEAGRRAALINAVIAAVGRAGTLEVTVAQIARDAGMSSALAHHYFGSKDRMFLAAMRRILSVYGDAVSQELARETTPRGRLDAILRASFERQNFEREVVAAWLTFYALTRRNDEARRLLAAYHGRLRSNLRSVLRPLTDRPEAEAERLGALIDGIYLRAALVSDPLDPACDGASALAMARGYVEEVLR